MHPAAVFPSCFKFVVAGLWLGLAGSGFSAVTSTYVPAKGKAHWDFLQAKTAKSQYSSSTLQSSRQGKRVTQNIALRQESKSKDLQQTNGSAGAGSWSAGLVITPENNFTYTSAGVSSSWARRDPEAAAAWLRASMIDGERPEMEQIPRGQFLIDLILYDLARDDPYSFQAWDSHLKSGGDPSPLFEYANSSGNYRVPVSYRQRDSFTGATSNGLLPGAVPEPSVLGFLMTLGVAVLRLRKRC